MGIRLVYLYVDNGSAEPGREVHWDKKAPSQNSFTRLLPEEGFFHLFSRMLETGIVDGVLPFIVSTRGMGVTHYTDDIVGYTVPRAEEIESFLTDDHQNIIFTRGGFKPWHPFLTRMSEQKRWMLFYRAATNRGAWPFWDVVFEDLGEENKVGTEGRFYLDFKKPIAPDMFFPKDMARSFDVCIGASHIHDKKGQWRVLDSLKAYELLYKKKLRCVMPGAVHKGEQTNRIRRRIEELELDIFMPGMLPRKELNDVYNMSKLFVHFGGAGQNDRGVLEALSCGTKVMLANSQYHPPFICNDSVLCEMSPTITEIDRVAQRFHALLEEHSESGRKKIVEEYQKYASIEDVILPQMSRLFSFFGKHPLPDRKALHEEYGLL